MGNCRADGDGLVVVKMMIGISISIETLTLNRIAEKAPLSDVDV